MTFKGSSCLSSSPSGLSLPCCPGLPPSVCAGRPDACASVLPHRHWPSGRRKKPLASPVCPLESASCGGQFRRLIRSLSLRPSCLLAPVLTRPERLSVLPAFQGFYFRALRSPCAPAGYHYDAKLRIASAGLPPASTAASLAALPPLAPVLPFTDSARIAVPHCSPASTASGRKG